MIKEEDLRIGNIYHSKKFNKPILLTASDIMEATINADYGAVSISPYISEMISAIPISVEWLENLGFKETTPRSGILRAFKKGRVRIEMSNSGNFYFKNRHVAYVHTLQDVYRFNELGNSNLITSL